MPAFSAPSCASPPVPQQEMDKSRQELVRLVMKLIVGGEQAPCRAVPLWRRTRDEA